MTTYKPSGKYSPLSQLYLVLVCLTLVPLIAWLYAYAVWYCPLIYINFFVTLAFAALIGFSVQFAVIRLGRVRSPAAALLFGALAGLWAWYVHWAIWIDLAINAEDGHGILISHVNYAQLLDLLRDPVGLFRVAGLINEAGLWSIFTIPFKGFLLWMVWFAEAAMILVIPPLVAVKKAEKPFNEKEGKWAREIKVSKRAFIHGHTAKSVQAGDLSVLQALQPGKEDNHHSLITLFDAGPEEWYVSVVNKYATTDEKGKLKFNDTRLLEYAAIHDSIAAALQQPVQKTTQVTTTPAANGQQDNSLYDISKTKIIADLLQTHPDQRDDAWHEQFHANILQAAFTCGNPQVITGPDGFPYFMLQFPESQKKFNPYSLLSIKDHVLKNGYGVALSTDGREVVMSLRHGDMVNLHVNGRLFSDADHTSLPENEILTQSTEILTARPSDEYLPTVTREVIKDFLQAQGIAGPKVMLMMRSLPEGPTSELVFNIYAQDFESEEAFESLMSMVQWFLPRQYVVTSVSRQSQEPETMVNL